MFWASIPSDEKEMTTVLSSPRQSREIHRVLGINHSVVCLHRNQPNKQIAVHLIYFSMLLLLAFFFFLFFCLIFVLPLMVSPVFLHKFFMSRWRKDFLSSPNKKQENKLAWYLFICICAIQHSSQGVLWPQRQQAPKPAHSRT